MKQSPLQLQLIVIAACGLAVCVAGLFFPKEPGNAIVGDFRFLLLIALLIVLSVKAIRARLGREELPEQAAEAPPPDVQERMPRLIAFLANPWTLTVLLAGVLASVAFATQNRAMYNDEAIWTYVARAWVHYGLPPYIGTVENKTPGIFYLFAVSDLLTGLNFWFPRLLGILASALTGYGLFAIGKRLWGRGAGLLAMLLYGLTTVSAARMDAPFTAQTETFMLAFSVLAVYLLVTTRQAQTLRQHLPAVFLAGCSLGAAIAFKQTAVITAAGLLFLYLSLKPPLARTFPAVTRDCLLFAGGGVLATFVSLVPLLLSGVSVGDYLQGAWLLLAGSGSSVSDLTVRMNRALWVMESADLQIYLVLLMVLIAVYKRLPASVPIAGLLAWYAFELFAVNSSGTYWGHQLRQALPPLALLGGMAWWALIKANFTREPVLRWSHYALIGLAIALIWTPPLGWWPLSAQSRAAKRAYTWVNRHTGEQDYVYTLGVLSANQILAYSQRRASSRYFNQYFMKTPGVEAEMRRDLAEKAPTYLVVEMNRSLSLLEELKVPAWVDRQIAESYTLEKQFAYRYRTLLDENQIGGFLIYRRNPPAAGRSRPADNSAE
ncbi:MAG: ArnT family glycosyltransferase [Armatimonadota bacterium]